MATNIKLNIVCLEKNKSDFLLKRFIMIAIQIYREILKNNGKRQQLSKCGFREIKICFFDNQIKDDISLISNL